MKMFFLFLSTAVFGVTFCEVRIPRQIWPVPNNPNYYWDGNDQRDFFDDGDFWLGPPKFDQPMRNQNGFRDDFGSVGGNNWDQNDIDDDFNSGGWNQNNFRDDFDSGRRNGRNQNRRTTTESSGPLSTTPRTIHVAPQGCTCPMTQQFNPVCGTDGNTYRNLGLLNCYKRCGTNVSQKRLGTC